MAPKRSLLQSAFVKAEAKKQPRARSHKSVTPQAAKALGDYIKSFSEQEIDSTVIDGLSLRARLTKDKAKNAAKLGSVTMGRTYYNGLRAMFSCMCLSPQAYKNSRVVEEDPKAFFENFQDIWPLVLPLDETKVVMSLKGGQSFNGCHVELNKVCTSVALGMACSAFALHIIMGDVAQNTIADYVAKVMKTKQITQEVIRKRRADAIGKCQGLPNITCLPAKRSVVFAYGAFSVALEFSCVQEQLVPLKVVVSSDAVTGAKAARAWAQSLLTVIEKPGAGKMQAQLASAQVKFQSIGPTWEIETGFLQTMIDGTGASNLEEDFLSHLSTKGGGPDLASATVNGTILVGSKLAQFASAGCVGAVKAAISICVTMQSGQAPKIPGNSTHFMQSVFSRLGFYATYQEKGSGGHVLGGRAAVEANLKDLKAVQSKNLGLNDLELVRVFSFLLPEPAQQEVTALAEVVFKGAQPATSHSKDSSSTVSSFKPAKSSQAAISSSITEAAAMFK